MESFGWEIVKQISNSEYTHEDFKKGLTKGYKYGCHAFFLDMVDLDELFTVEDEEDLKHSQYIESLGYKLGYTLAVDDCFKLFELGDNLNSKLREKLKHHYLR